MIRPSIHLAGCGRYNQIIQKSQALLFAHRAEKLLNFLEPMFEDWDIDSVKGTGWGLKTLGRHYPELVADWLTEQVSHRQRRPRALMLRKALTYLSDEQRIRVTGTDA